MRYSLRLNSGSIGQTWNCDFTQPSDKMAMNWAEQIVRSDPVAAAATTATLFNLDSDRCVVHWELYQKMLIREVQQQ